MNARLNVLLLLLCLESVAPVAAQQPSKIDPELLATWKRCDNWKDDVSLKQRIADCGTVISAGRSATNAVIFSLAFYDRGRLLCEDGAFQDSIRDFDAAIARATPSLRAVVVWRVYQDRAECLFKAGRLKEAVASVDLAFKSWPENAFKRRDDFMVELRGDIELAKGHFNAAIKYYARGIGAGPGSEKLLEKARIAAERRAAGKRR